MNEDLDSLTERAEKMLDGMTVNRGVFARDVKRMAAELRQWRDAHARSKPNGPDKGLGGFADLFGEGIWGGRK